jgi:hypothetical protein
VSPFAVRGQSVERLTGISAVRKTGAERFTAAGQPLGPTVADFRGWSRSDLLDNTERGVLAEFIVAIAAGGWLAELLPFLVPTVD